MPMHLIAKVAAIGLEHPKWQARPLLLVVKTAGQEVTKEELLSYLAQKAAK